MNYCDFAFVFSGAGSRQVVRLLQGNTLQKHCFLFNVAKKAKKIRKVCDFSGEASDQDAQTNITRNRSSTRFSIRTIRIRHTSRGFL